MSSFSYVNSAFQSFQNTAPITLLYGKITVDDKPDSIRANLVLIDANGNTLVTLEAHSRVAMLSMIAPGPSNAAQREKALATLAGLVGALTLARAADDLSLSDEILNAALATLGGKPGATDSAIKTRLRGTNPKKVKGRQTVTPSPRN